MAKQKSLFGLWAELKVSDINRLLKAHGVRLVMKTSKSWGDQVTVTAHALPATGKMIPPSAGQVCGVCGEVKPIPVGGGDGG